MAQEPVRYLSEDEDSARWLGFPFRAGDIVISTRSKTGTTWVQMICALLIFQVPELAAPLGRYSPWLDRVIYPRDEAYARLAAQEHRRFIKTHTPLDGIPLDPRATYIVTARHPLDMAVSLYHQSGNINRSWQRQRDGKPAPPEPEPERKPLGDWLLDWIDHDADPRAEMDSLPGVMWHLSDAWARRSEPNVLLIRYEDLCADLAGQMRWLAAQLAITVPEQAWPGLTEAATFERMRASADQMAGPSRILKSSAAFFRRGRPGAGREILTDQQIARYHARAAAMAPPDMLAWLHSPGRAGERAQPAPMLMPVVEWSEESGKGAPEARRADIPAFERWRSPRRSGRPSSLVVPGHSDRLFFRHGLAAVRDRPRQGQDTDQGNSRRVADG